MTTTYTEKDILAALDKAQAGECWEWPDFGHLDYEILLSRLVAYRDDARWAIVFSLIQWCPASSTLIEVVTAPLGNCVEIPGGDELSVRMFDFVNVEFDTDNPALEPRGFVSEVVIRDQSIDLDKLEIPEQVAGRDETFGLSIAASEHYRDILMPTDAELSRFFPGSLPPRFMELDVWHHPESELPSETEVFRLLARAMVEDDPALYLPTEKPNTDWRSRMDIDTESSEGDGADYVDEDNFDGNASAGNDGLTDEQRQRALAMLKSMEVAAKRTDPIDQAECIAAFRAAYAAAGLKEPKFMFFSSPKMALRKAESMVSKPDDCLAVLGDEVNLCRKEHYSAVYVNNLAANFPGWPLQNLGNLHPYRDMWNYVDGALEKASKGGRYFLRYYGNNIFWVEAATTFSQLAVLQACDAYKPSEACVAWMAALATCGHAFTFEKYCLISERPAAFHHPELIRNPPQNRVTVKWEDGFTCSGNL